jgi:hypothetical protein
MSFRRAVTITVEVPAPAGPRRPVRRAVYDVLGREGALLHDHALEPGRHTVVWEAQPLPSGVYIAVLKIGAQTRTRRMLHVR